MQDEKEETGLGSEARGKQAVMVQNKKEDTEAWGKLDVVVQDEKEETGPGSGAHTQPELAAKDDIEEKQESKENDSKEDLPSENLIDEV